MTAEMLGASPENVLLVGIVGESYEPGQPLSEKVSQSVEKAIEAVLAELQRMGHRAEKKTPTSDPGIWWGDVPITASADHERP